MSEVYLAAEPNKPPKIRPHRRTLTAMPLYQILPLIFRIYIALYEQAEK